MNGRLWEADPGANLVRRLGKSALELDRSKGKQGCPDIWELSNGDVAVIAAISRTLMLGACRKG
jgi:hypothetical protein